MSEIVRGGRLFCSKHSAVPASKWFAGVRRQGSCAASLPSEAPKRKRVSRDERRAMVESFIMRYRSMNAGKFPSASITKKEVGGSYYVVRELVQELEYNSNVNPSESSIENLSGNASQTPRIHGGFVLEESNVLKDDAKCLEKLEDDRVEDIRVDSSDKLFKVPDQQEIVQVFYQHLASAEGGKTESETVQSHFGEVEGDLLKERGLEAQIPCSHGDLVLEETNVLKDEVKCHEKLEDGKVVDVHVDNSDNFFRDPDQQEIAQFSGEHLASAEGSKAESETVQSPFGEVEGDLLKERGLEAQIPGFKTESQTFQSHFGEVEGDLQKEGDLKEQIPGGHGGFVLEENVQLSDQHIASAEQCKTEYQTVQSHFGKAEGDLLKEEVKVGKEDADKKEQTAPEDLQGIPEHKAEHIRQSLEGEKRERNLPNEQRDDSEHSKKSTLWENLKSFAGGIINIWRKR